ncbi:MAG: hypothetical protein PUF77_06310 [Clostridiales bacterium]|nr:hypothetical protein [Clostridiales bacterium]
MKYLKRLQHGRRLPPDTIDIFFFKFGEKCVTRFIISRFSAGIVNIFADKRHAAILPCDVEEQAQELFERLIKQRTEREGITEKLKAPCCGSAE